MMEKTVFRDQPRERPCEQMRYWNGACALNREERKKNIKSMPQGENRCDQKTGITLDLSNRQGDHKKLEEKVFSLAISPGEISTNLTPDRKCLSPSADWVLTQTTWTSISTVFN